jgi:ribokinase
MIHVLGSINIDYSSTVARLPAAGETVMGDNLQLTPGGKGANQALAARRAGAEVKLTGAVGTDEVAPQATALLREAGVDMSSVAVIDGPTGCAFVFVDSGSENQIIIIPGANGEVTQNHGSQLSITADDILLLQLEVPIPAVCAAAEAAKKAGAMVIANLAPYQTMPAVFYENVDLLILNETEAELLSADIGLSPIQPSDKSAEALRIAENLRTQVIITLGSDGLVATDESQTVITIPGLRIDPIDTVGAGDTFAGFLGAMLARGSSLQNACKIANAAAALACTKAGAQTAIPTLDELSETARNVD